MILGRIDGKRVLFSGDNLWLFNPHARGIEHEIPIQLTVMRNSFQLDMHTKCALVLQNTRPDVLCPGHGNLIAMDESRIAEYAEYIECKDKAFRDIVDEPVDFFIDLFWARMLPYMSKVRAGDEVVYTIKIRNNLLRSAVYEARLLPAFGWQPHTSKESISLEPGQQGEILLTATAPTRHDLRRRLITAEVLIDGVSQGPVCEALVCTYSDAE